MAVRARTVWRLGFDSVAALEDHTRHCVLDAEDGNQTEKTEELMGAVKRLLRRG